jgi:type II restriction/modification system DNA methylase subunit YeeA
MPRKSASSKRSRADHGRSYELPFPLTIPEFVARWKNSQLSERSAAHSHFIDLCDLLGQPRPAAVDGDGSTYTFEKGVNKISGGKGFADIWKRHHFAWEYKGKHKDLNTAYAQLLQYREDLENPELLIVCDFDRFEVHANFNNTRKHVYKFNLADLLANKPTATCSFPPLEVLRALFTDPQILKPEQTTAQVTEDAAAEFSKLAASLRQRGISPERAAHFLMRLLFCLFSEDIGLLPEGLFTRLVEANKQRPTEFTRRLRQLFTAMAGDGGTFGEHDIPYFDGGLFLDDEAYELTSEDMKVLSRAAALNWASIEPAVFGTLFERSLDPDKRSQLGAHYTSKDDILLIVEPVLMRPLRKRWDEVRREATELVEKAKRRQASQTKSMKSLAKLLKDFSSELASARVLDPACGSGNFLYIALKLMLDLEKEVSMFAAGNGLSAFMLQCGPEQLYGIESNVYAHELASIVVWIGYIQWQHDNGLIKKSHPILRPLENIHRMDAILNYDEKGVPTEPEWPDADVIIGNPPFLGDKKMREALGDKYVDHLRHVYEGRVPGGADLVMFWFERAREQISGRKARRAGLLATNSVSMIANRKVLKRIKETGDIFMAWSDRPWILDGAAVRVSMIGFDNGDQTERVLDGLPICRVINSDLTAGVDATSARVLNENAGVCFLGIMKGGPFDIDTEAAHEMLSAPLNPNNRPNSDVVKRRLGGQDVVGSPRDGWIIDFVEMTRAEAALYELPFEYVRTHVKPVRDKTRDVLMHNNWWLHGRSRPALRRALRGMKRCIVTPEVSKHRIFAWMNTEVVPDHKLHVIARDDDYTFGILQSHVHEVWTLAQCSWIGVGNDPSYSSSRTFETFPFPWALGAEPPNDRRAKRIATSARELVKKRDAWLKPPDIAVEEAKKRTLTKLYNENFTWLKDAHKELDDAVLPAYGWPKNLSDDEILARLLQLNAERTQQPQIVTPPKKAPTSVHHIPPKSKAKQV